MLSTFYRIKCLKLFSRKRVLNWVKWELEIHDSIENRGRSFEQEFALALNISIKFLGNCVLSWWNNSRNIVKFFAWLSRGLKMSCNSRKFIQRDFLQCLLWLSDLLDHEFRFYLSKIAKKFISSYRDEIWYITIKLQLFNFFSFIGILENMPFS